ncbi:MAG TPA: hypothetical protein P5185_09345 [Oscillospiraceae bacterium]|nr:hypothetical protein [Oscillospiraceae bacterium]
MTWETAKNLAEKYLAVLEQSWAANGIDPAGFAGQPTPMTDYECDEDLRLLRPEDGPDATVEDHRILNRAVARLLRTRYGMRPIAVPLRAADYLRWLAAEGRKNDAANRALFAAGEFRRRLD